MKHENKEFNLYLIKNDKLEYGGDFYNICRCEEEVDTSLYDEGTVDERIEEIKSVYKSFKTIGGIILAKGSTIKNLQFYSGELGSSVINKEESKKLSSSVILSRKARNKVVDLISELTDIVDEETRSLIEEKIKIKKKMTK